MLLFWTAAEPALIKKTFGESLRAMRPVIPAHQFIEWKEDAPPPEPKAGDVLLVCGTKPLETLRRCGHAPKNRTVNSLRETPLKFGGGYALITFDPGVTNSEPEQKQVMDWDVRLAARLMATGTLAPDLSACKYRWVNSFEQLIAQIEEKHALTGKPVDVSMDTETMGFYPWYPDKDLVSISFTAEFGRSDVLYTGPQLAPVEYDPDVPLFDQIEWLLTSPKVKLRVGNGKFDLVWIKVKWGITCTNFKFDPILAASLLDENRSNSLNMLAKIMTPIGGYDDDFNAKFDKSHMEAVPPSGDYLTYAGGDTDALHRAGDVVREQLLEDEPLANFYVTILHPAARAFEKIEERGVLVDQHKFAVLREDLQKVIDDGYAKALELLPNKMRIKYRDRIDDQLAQGKSPMLPAILKEYFFSPNGLNLKPLMLTGKTKEPSTAKAHLKMFGDVPAAKAMVEALTDSDVAAKTKSTFVDGFLKHLRPDGRLHPTYMLFHGGINDDEQDESGTVTGRLSAKDPAFQIIPKKTKWAKRIRECYIAPPGKVILLLDYSQGELRVVACVANEKNMIAAYEAGMDLHAVTGARLGGVDYEEFLTWKKHDDAQLQKLFKDLRDRAKAGNFGLLYGMGVEGFQAYAWANYGLKLTYEEAESIRSAFFALYPGLLDYHDRQRKFVGLHEMVRSPLGRIRHLPAIRAWDREIRARAERQAINSPIQSCLSDMMLWSIALIEDAYPNDEIAIFGMIHDALVAYVDEDKIALRAAQAAEIMGNLPFKEVGWKPQLPFPAEAEAGPNLGQLEEIKLAA